MSDPIPGVDPVEPGLMDPYPWLTTMGRTTYRKARGAERQEKCEDCMHVIEQFLTGREFERTPGLARLAAFVRTQQQRTVLLCTTHTERRKEKEHG